MKVLITGGTGLVGRFLQKELLIRGDEVIVLSRSKKTSDIKGLSYAFWDIEKGIIDVEKVCSANSIVHLAGANIAEGRWTEKRKQILIDSRVQSANLLLETLQKNKHEVESFVSASGINCYGVKTTTTVYEEKDPFGNDFLAKVCQVWEAAANKFDHMGIRTVCLRTGVVFAKQDSAFQKMAKPIEIGIGSALGSGKQHLSYIFIDDLCAMYIKAITDTGLQGPYNAVAANNTNTEVTKTIAEFLKKPLFFPKVPAFVLQLIFGEMASVLLEGSAASNAKIKQTGFKFKYPNLEAMLTAIYNK